MPIFNPILVGGGNSTETLTTLDVTIQGDRGITLYYDNQSVSVDNLDGSKTLYIKPGTYVSVSYNASRTSIESTNLTLRSNVTADFQLYQAVGDGPFTLTTTDA